MSGHDFGSVLPLVLAVIFVISAVRRRLVRGSARAAAEYAAARTPLVPAPSQPPAPPRRRLAPSPLVRPAAPVLLAAAARVAAPAAGRTPQPLPLEAAAAFPTLDMSLGDALIPRAAASTRRPRRGIGGAAALGSPAWGANAVLALEILGPPVSLRSGATLGAPHAF